ncbi:RidA family protein [Colwellia sp. BRX10-3]|uniref:RidA family protein n=1 Tax=Colwellia sp. BRX10-3 TaxID=2759844 RepID=UPI0015F54110|nr:Rid family hydrolase [Colwellia sp. BRX10-3]MBA6389179.1 RidA family protein [Colwellia sp. BRX10-3]
MSTIFNSAQAPKPVGLYPHARQVGNLLFLSGVGPRQAGSSDIPGVVLDQHGEIISYDIEAQCHSVFQNVSTILASAGADWMDLVDVTVFLTNMKDDFAIYNRIYADYFSENLPCRTTVEINKLPTPIAIELKCIAALPNPSSTKGA